MKKKNEGDAKHEEINKSTTTAPVSLGDENWEKKGGGAKGGRNALTVVRANEFETRPGSVRSPLLFPPFGFIQM